MSEPGGGGGGGEDGSAGLEVSAVQNVADVAVLQKHLRKLVPLLLEDGGEAPAALEAALEEKSALEQMRKFLADPQVHTVLVERSTLKGAAAGAPRGRTPRPPDARGAGGPKAAPGTALATPLPAGVPRVPLAGHRKRRDRTRGPRSRRHPNNGVALSLRPVKMAELGGDSGSRPNAGGGRIPAPVSHEPLGFDSWPGRPREGCGGAGLGTGRLGSLLGWRSGPLGSGGDSGNLAGAGGADPGLRPRGDPAR